MAILNYTRFMYYPEWIDFKIQDVLLGCYLNYYCVFLHFFGF